MGEVLLGLFVIQAIVHGGISQRRLDLVQGLAGVLNMNFSSHCTGENACWTTDRYTRTWKRATVAHLAAARRAQLNQLSLAPTKASSTLIAAPSSIRNLLKHRIIIIKNMWAVLYLVHTRVDSQTTPRHPNHLWVVPLYAIFANKNVLAGLPLGRHILGIIAEEAHAEQGTE